MAKRNRSNKTTQNPKGNQEKTADIGIQEHSEHTAENKQPESKDNAQKKDESTCLCQFFKKIAEWICAKKNKNSKKADENAIEKNDATKRAKIKQADTVEQPKEQTKLTDILETVSKILGISAILGTFIGGFFIYKYLNYLGQLSIFPEAITNPSALIATAIVFGGIALFLYIKFFLAFLVGINTKSGQGWNTSKQYFYYLIFYLISCVLDYPVLYPLISDWCAFILFLIFMLMACLLALLIGIDNDYKKNKKFFTIICLIPIYLIFINFFLGNLLSLNSANFVRFAETPENSSWYLLHNNFQQNNGFQETSGIDRNDLFKLKQKFKCSALSEKEKVEKGISCSSIPEQRNNALYGYMAWNLGDTKVFCPPTAENNKGKKEAAKLATECIVISGKFLQILNKNYIDIMPKER
ncbi:hypothetical protein [Neisseria mucosa]|uniref:hypothetical protein n=1 Tax=Neisseria mucosa TaxID=488 RepID=UPI000D3CDFFC|nr:hypothetical protein [Neisseria mucosa]